MRKAILFVFVSLSVITFSQQINEVCASNFNHQSFPFLGYPDWVEFKNNTAETIDMTGYYFSDNIENPTKWVFPGFIIPPNGLFLIPAKEGVPSDNVISFNIQKEGCTLFLFTPEGHLVDYVVQPSLQRNHSYGRVEEEWYFFDTPTPSDENTGATAYKGYAHIPTINRVSGAYSGGTNITVLPQSEGEYAHYTTNGNLESSISVDGAIVLQKTIALRAFAKGDSLLPSAAVDRVYFVNISHDLPVVNINIDSLVLFDSVNGIYMDGPDVAEEFPFAGANYWQDIEVNAHYSYFNKDLQLVDDLPCDLKIHGGPGSRIRPMKSLQLRIQEGGEATHFNAKYFEDKSVNKFKRIILRNGGNDFCHTCIQDGSLQKYLNESHLNVDFLGFQPVVVYLNGQYLGLHNIREKVDRYYLESNYGVNPETVNILEGGSLTAIEGESTSFQALRYFAETNDLNEQDNFDYISQHLDINSLVDYFITELYINNRDWPHNNIKLWNAPESPKWRYICYDLDVGFRYSSYDLEDIQSLAHLLNNLTETNPHVAIFNALLENEGFKRYFVNRYADLLNSYLASNMLIGGFNRDKAYVSNEMGRHYEEWCGALSIWHERFKGLEGFIANRPEIIHDELVSVFNFPSKAEIFVSVYPSGKGQAKLNTLDLIQFPFKGTYFEDNLIELTAHPNEGETFYYWENLVTGERIPSSKITVNPVMGDYYVAVFKATDQVFNITIAPNPIIDNALLTFCIPKTGEITINLEATDGRVVKQLEYWTELAKGTHRLGINLGNIPQGIYYLTISSGYTVERKRIIKL